MAKESVVDWGFNGPMSNFAATMHDIPFAALEFDA
jgi:hypothetical protein